MEIRHRILQYNNSPKYAILRKELDSLEISYKDDKLGLPGLEDRRAIEFTISEDDPLYPKIAELINQHDLYAQVGLYWSEADIEAAEWVYASAGEYQYPQPENSYREATYDLSDYCPRCGIGMVQARPFRLERDFNQKARFLGMYWVNEIFARPEIPAIFKKEGISGVEFSHPIRHKSGEDIKNVYQMKIQTIAEPGLRTEGLETVTCKANNEEALFAQASRAQVQQETRPHYSWARHNQRNYPYCGRVKYHHPRREPIRFTRNSLRDLPDIAKSYEYFGSGAGARRLIFMKRRVVKLVESWQLEGLKFVPIELV
jgi:hypothetical protein